MDCRVRERRIGVSLPRMRSTGTSTRTIAPLLVGTVAALSGCLSDPPAYDACTEDESLYFVVPPKGCGGHELATLYASESRGARQSSMAYDVWTRPVADEEYVYWVDTSGRVLRTAQADGNTDVLLEGISSSGGIDGFDRERQRLYVRFDSEYPLQRLISQLYGIDVTTGEVHLMADWVDIPIGGLVTFGERFYLVQAQYELPQRVTADDPTGAASVTLTHSMLTGSLDWSATSHIADLTACSPGEVIALTINEQYLYYLDFYQSLLVTIDPASCARVAEAPIEPLIDASVRLVQTAAEPYLVDCNYSVFPFSCDVYRLDSGGRLVPIASELALRSRLGLSVGEGNLFWIGVAPSRLQMVDLATSEVTTLAGALEGETTMAVRPDAVYVQQRVYSSEDGMFDDGENMVTERIVRVTR